MPGILTSADPGRRRFVQRAMQACLVCACRGLQAADVAASNSENSRHWALLADTHVAADREAIYRGASPYKNLQAAVSAIGARAPSGALIVGDVARSDGQIADYQLVRSMLEPLAADVPVFLGLGNHDHRRRFHKVFSESASGGKRQPLAEKHVVVIDQAPIVRIILLDSLLAVNQAPGALGLAQRDWLRQYLSQSDKTVPIVIAVHHTFGRGGGHLEDTDQLFQLVDQAPQVKALFYGHSHRFQITERRGLHLVNLPPVGYAFDSVTPLGWLEAEFTPVGARLTLRTVDPKAPRDASRTDLPWRQ